MTDKQRIFCDEYIRCNNQTEAYLIAYPHTKNRNTAGVLANQLRKHKEIASYIKEQTEKISNGRIADAQELLERLTAMIRGELEEETVVWVRGEPTTMKTKIKIREQQKAIEMLGKYHRLFTEKIELSGTFSQVEIIDDV
ncbi:MAG: terminase small subunit [Oscillospiraceae bacterium]|nr:terminase small subunit [Oscillospiraceae bacterium]